MNKTKWFGLRPHLILEKKRKIVSSPSFDRFFHTRGHHSPCNSVGLEQLLDGNPGRD